MRIPKLLSVEGTAVWKSKDIGKIFGHRCCFLGNEVEELAGKCDSSALQKSPARLVSFTDAMARVRADLLTGVGFSLLHNFQGDSPTVQEAAKLLTEFIGNLGMLAPQNAESSLITYITDQGNSLTTDSAVTRGHRGRVEMKPHTDSADVVALLCVRQAPIGGTTYVCSSWALYNEILKSKPEYMQSLINGFHFDLTGKTCRFPAVTEQRIPVFDFGEDGLSCTFNRARIVLGMQKAGLKLSILELAAIDYLEQLASSPEFAVSCGLEAGDCLFINNHCALHARDEYEDLPNASQKRLLLRLWFNWPKR